MCLSLPIALDVRVAYGKRKDLWELLVITQQKDTYLCEIGFQNEKPFHRLRLVRLSRSQVFHRLVPPSDMISC